MVFWQGRKMSLSIACLGVKARRLALVAVLGAVVLAASIPSAASARGGGAVTVRASVSGSTLSVYLVGVPNSNCALRLGGGKGAKSLPGARIAANGHGRTQWDIPSDTSTGNQPLHAACGHGGVRHTGRAFVDIPESAVAGTLSTVLNIVLDVLLGGSLVLFLWLLIEMVVRESSKGERLMRSLALVCGAIVALGAQATGVGFASFTVEALTGNGSGEGIAKFLSIVLPGGVAAAFGWYFTQVMRRNAVMGMRLVSFLGMLTVISFTVIFAEATKTQGVFLGAAAIPNASFVVGLILSVIFLTPTADGRGGGLGLGELLDMIRGRTVRPAEDGGGRPVAPPVSPPSARSPFADD